MDVVVIGAGISGLITSIELSRFGANVTVLEEHERVGIPSHCAGIVSFDYHEKIDIPLNPELDMNLLYGLRFTNGSDIVEVRYHKPIARVLSRDALDQYLAKIALENGSKILTSTRALSVLQDKRKVTVKDHKDVKYIADYAVVAEGITRSISGRIWQRREEGSVFPAAQTLAKSNGDASVATVLLSDEISPDFFAYLAPISEDRVRIGVASMRRNVMESLRLAAKKLDVEPIGKPILWGIWIGGPAREIRSGRIFRVGDAAGMVKATSGGGIVFGGLSAKLVSRKIIYEWTDKEDKTIRELEKHIRSQMRHMYTLRKAMNFLGQTMVAEAIIHGIEPNRASDILGEVDFDFHGELRKLIGMARRTPFWLVFGLKAMRQLVGGLFKYEHYD